MRKILYYTDLMPFLTDSKKAISKLKKNFEIFNENKDKIRLVWHPYTRTEEFLRLNNSECIDEYKSLIAEYSSADFVDFDESTDVEGLAATCDAYYGDYSDIISYFTEKNKPVMLQNVDII